MASDAPPLPSSDWELAGRRVIRFAVAYAVAAVAAVPLLLAAEHGPYSGFVLPAGLLIGNLLVGAVTLGGILGLLVCSAVWMVQAARLARSYGSPVSP